MRYTENALNVLTVRSYPKKGPAWIDKNLRGSEGLEDLCRLLETSDYEFLKRRDGIEKSIARLGDTADGVVALGDSQFPTPRGDVKSADRPYALFYRGDLSLLGRENLNVAVIGVLNPDDKVALSERIVAEEVARRGATIVSGLALGCDTIAHRTALESDAKTVAILPSTLGSILPKENVGLAEAIVERGGLLVSEYYEAPRGRNDMVTRFIVRDRLQALYSDAVLLAASYAPNNLGNDCGSRHAMEKARLYGIRRGVIYNEAKHAGNPMYDLNRQILSQDRSVVRIDSGNMAESVGRLLRREPQGALF